MMRRLAILTLLTAIAVSTSARSPTAARDLDQAARDVDSWWRTLLKDEEAFDAHRTRVFDDWRKHGSYYALLEIVEGRIEPALGRIHVEQVLDLLGTQNIDRDYPSSRRDNFLVWSSQRLIPQGSYLVIRFDAKGIARSIDWVSE